MPRLNRSCVLALIGAITGLLINQYWATQQLSHGHLALTKPMPLLHWRASHFLDGPLIGALTILVIHWACTKSTKWQLLLIWLFLAADMIRIGAINAVAMLTITIAAVVFGVIVLVDLVALASIVPMIIYAILIRRGTHKPSQ